MTKFILNNETKKNSHGFYLLNDGGHFERFNENPVMLNMHDLNQPIGKWLHLRTKGNLLIADPEFDKGDPDAVKIEGKVNRGYIKGASVGIIINSAEWRTKPETKAEELYVTDWELFEASIVSVPSNAGALSLKVYDEECREVSEDKVGLHIENIVKLSLYGKEREIPQNKLGLKVELTTEVLKALGVKSNANSEVVNAAILKMIQEIPDTIEIRLASALKANLILEDDVKYLRELGDSNLAAFLGYLDSVEKRARELLTKKVDAYFTTNSRKFKKSTAKEIESMRKLAHADFDMFVNFMEGVPENLSLSEQIRMQSFEKTPENRLNWSLDDYRKKDPEALRKDPDLYKQLIENSKEQNV